MAIRGTKPGKAGVSDNRHKPVHEWTDVPNVPNTNVYPLPPLRCDGEPWSQQARAKWEAWSVMPHAALWSDAEWHFVMDTLELCELFYGGNSKVASEIRNREKVFGTTLEFRRDLRIRYVDAKEHTPAAVADMDDYREL